MNNYYTVAILDMHSIKIALSIHTNNCKVALTNFMWPNKVIKF